ncbi:nucleotide exchange factor GrpE [Longispora sp. NPDC051575]|uniref:nucleotide exchange factor GrpE n=1 Tax=Longispora sp. NPDC051575 TaxID=3154943 RepID=UPI003436D6D6
MPELNESAVEPAAFEEEVAEPGAPDPLDLRLGRIEAALGDVAAARERTIDRLHEENQRLRVGERQLLLRPLVTDLHRLRDDLLRQAGALPGEITREQAAALLASYVVSVEQTLERCGVRVLTAAPGDPYDPYRHRAVGTVPAAGPEGDGLVAEVLGDGYHDAVADRVVAPAAVRVARWTPPAGPGATPPA